MAALKVIAGAIQADVDIANAVEPPTKGCPGSLGLQVTQPADWQARIAAGDDVPGCTYAAMGMGNTLAVSARVQERILISAVVNLLSNPLQLEVPLLILKLAA